MSQTISLPIFPSYSGGRQRSNPQVEDLDAELRRSIHGEVRFDAGSRALYAADLSMYRQVPIGVVLPYDLDDVVATVAVCHAREVPILGRGCGTSLAGQCCNVAVIIDFSKYINRILDLDPVRRTAWVEPGVICDQLRDAAAQYHLMLAPDPATHEYCTLGGMIGNNSCGAHSLMGGKTSDNVEELEVLTYDGLRLGVGSTSEAELEHLIRAGGRRGEIYRGLRNLRDRYADLIRTGFPHIPRRVSGYNLEALLPENGFQVARALVGSESTCALVLGGRMRLVPNPRFRSLLVIGYSDPFKAGDQVPAVLEYHPIALEAVTSHVLENMRRKGNPVPGAHLLPDGNTWLLVEFGGDSAKEVADRAGQVLAKLRARGDLGTGTKLLTDPADQQAVWKVREAGVGASRVPHVEDALPSWEDSAVPPEKLGGYLRDFVKLLHRYEYDSTLFGHFGQGCVHSRITFRTRTPQGVQQYRAFMNDAADLVVSYGGSLSGEHGDGQARGELLPKMFGPELMQAFRDFKAIWDPTWKMNPGKLIDANPLTSDLRYGPDYHPHPVQTYFQFPEDRGSFAAGVERCFGVGKCRRLEGGTMCPSFMATREEKHSTRGRAHLLFELMRGEVLQDGWRDEAVKDSLDLCLACKGCKGDCPVSVDVATYKAEFLAHYYQGRLRPRSAYALGLAHHWARLASYLPTVANVLSQTPYLRDLAKALAGLAMERPLPPLARQTFRRWFRERPPRNVGSPPVVLWPDTFNNYFLPHTAQAAVEVLEAAGREVFLPRKALCCGRPLYDYGMLDRAKQQLRQVLDCLRPVVRAGIPLVGLEPSCVAVFRDELVNLFPHDEDAQRLSRQVFLLSEFLVKAGYRPPRLQRKALLHGHCHQKALMGMDAEQQLLKEVGLELEAPDSGCCGLAGSFGYERQHYELSMKVGEHVLLPAVREASKDTLIIADGFSCRCQIEHGTDRRALHLAEILQMAALPGGTSYPLPYPEAGFVEDRPVVRSKSAAAATVVGGLLAAGGIGWLAWRRLSSARSVKGEVKPEDADSLNRALSRVGT
ncbi:MAG TPA: FAD-linked oxidase C-terminal domain-containing protein [Gemmataceae bacterium]|nr:FAD-linked oxidase C-terminal domain-containing protein [Gemmataceae bacterium]